MNTVIDLLKDPERFMGVFTPIFLAKEEKETLTEGM